MSQSEWQSIRTVPKDGTVVLLYSPGRRARGEGLGRFMGRYKQPEYSWVLVANDKDDEPEKVDDLEPTHWMPLPEPPK